MKSIPSSQASSSPSPPARGNAVGNRCVPGSRATSRPPSMLGKGQFSIYLPRRVDSEYYVKSPVKIRAEMFLCPEHLGAGGVSFKNIPCSARAEKLTEETHFGVVNVPIKIEAEVILSPGINYSCKTSTPLNGEVNRPNCTVRIIEPEQGPDEVDSWQFGNKTRESTSKCQAHNRFKGEKSQMKHRLVEELKLDDNCKRTKKLTRQLASYLDQVLELNKKIHKLQDKLREEESKGMESSEKVHIAEQQCKLLEQKLKAAECRAKVAEHRAEAIKQRTKVLSVSCGRQGVQLKDMARQVELFVRSLETQKVVALDNNKVLERRQGLLQGECRGTSEAAGINAAAIGSSRLCTIARTRPFQLRNPSSQITDALENSPDLNSPSTDCFYQTVTVQELSDKYVLFLCRRSLVDQQHRLRPDREEQHEKTTSDNTISGANLPLALPPMHTELLLNQLLQMAPNWHGEFDSSRRRAEELIQRCAFQALKLRDLSQDLDCFPSTLRGEAAVASLTSTSTSLLKGKVTFVEEDVTPSSESTPVSEARVEQTISLHIKVADQMNRCLEKYLFNLAEASEALLPVKKVPHIDAWIQTIPEQPFELHLSPESKRPLKSEQPLDPQTFHTPVSPLDLLQIPPFPSKYEVRAWRIAFQTIVQGFLVWLGLLLLPEVSFCGYLPPPT